MPKSFLQKAFGPVAAVSAFVVGGLLMNHYAFGDEQRKIVHDQQARQASAKQLEERYNDSPRLHAIVEELDKDFGNDEYGNQAAWLLSNHISLELSAECMPPDGMIQVFKDRLLINPFLSVHDQARILSLAIPYMRGQIHDRITYGVGESFTISGSRLIPAGHGGSNSNPSTACSP